MAGARRDAGGLARREAPLEVVQRGLASTTVAAELKELKQRLFVGRQEACNLFADALGAISPWCILNVSGTSGTGKSTLLDAFRRIAEEQGALYVYLDGASTELSRDALVGRIFQVLGITQLPGRLAAGDCLRMLYKEVQRRRVVLTIDGYDAQSSFDRWLREWFLVRLPAGVLTVIASRTPLQGRWRESDAWRQLVRPVRLDSFDRADTQDYLARHGVKKRQTVDALWRFAEGHPRALSLGVAVVEHEGEEQAESLWERPDVVGELARSFLAEVREDALIPLVRAAVVTHRFDRDVLAHMTGDSIEPHLFLRLVRLSFFRREGTEWTVDEVARKAIGRDLEWSSPSLYFRLRRRARHFWARAAAEHRDGPEGARSVAELMYFCEDEMVRALLHPAGAAKNAGSVVRVRLAPDSIASLLQQWAVNWDQGSPPPVHFTDPDTGLRLDCTPSPADLRRQREWMHLWPAAAPGEVATHLLRDGTGTPRGLALVWQRTGEDGEGGYFIPLVTTADPSDVAAWAALLRDLFGLVLHPSRLGAAAPLPFLQTLLLRLGFSGPEQPPVPSEAGVDVPWFSRAIQPDFLGELGPDPEGGDGEIAAAAPAGARPVAAPAGPAAGSLLERLTPREREMAMAVYEGLSNADIAARFHVAETTVKKHLTHVFEKTETMSRSQLISRLHRQS